VDALGFQMQDNALAQALGLQSRRDNLGLAEQDLQRAAISDASGLSNTRNALDLNEAQLTGNLRGAATLQSRLAQAGLQFDAANLQQNVADRTLARNLTATSPTQREVFEEGVRQNQFGEGLARNADQRAGQALESDLFGEVQQGANRAPRQTLTGRGFEDNLSTSDLQRLLATNQDTRAGEALQSDLFGEVQQNANGPARQTESGLTNALNRMLAGDANTRAGQASQSDLFGKVDGVDTQSGLTNALNRLLAGNADSRAGQSLESDLFGTNTSQAGVRQTEGGLTNALNRLLAGNADTRAQTGQDESSRNALITQILSSTDPGLNGRLDEFAGALGQGLDGPAGSALMRALGLTDPVDVNNDGVLDNLLDIDGDGDVDVGDFFLQTSDENRTGSEDILPPGGRKDARGNIRDREGNIVTFVNGKWVKV
jgi:hypothetical protein